MPRVFTRLIHKGLVGDERLPNVIRLSPVVLYNTFSEVGLAVKLINEALEEEEELEGDGKEKEEKEDEVGGVVDRDIVAGGSG